MKFPRYGVCTSKQNCNFILGSFQQKLPANFSENLRKLYLDLFWVLLSRVNKGLHFCYFFLFLVFYRCAKFQKKNPINRLWLQTYRRTDGWTDVWKSMKSQDLPFNGSNNALQFPQYRHTLHSQKQKITEEQTKSNQQTHKTPLKLLQKIHHL